MSKKIPFYEFRGNLLNICRPVKVNKTILTVTHRSRDHFKVISTNPVDVDLFKLGLLTVRDRPNEFFDLLEEHGSIVLTAYKTPLVVCVKL